MNQLVNKLGLKDSHFVNTTGIHDDDHYTTAYDMAKITQYALKNKNLLKSLIDINIRQVMVNINGSKKLFIKVKETILIHQ